MAKAKIFSTPTCHYCRLAKEWMQENNVEFEEVDVKADLEARKFMVEKSNQMGVPVTITAEGQVLVGFNGFQFKEAFGIE